MIVYLLLENHNKRKLETSLRTLEAILFDNIGEEYNCDQNVKRLIPLLTPDVQVLTLDATSRFRQYRNNMDGADSAISNMKLFDAFECYIRKDFTILDTIPSLLHRTQSIGVTLPKQHREYFLDPAVRFVALGRKWLDSKSCVHRI